MDRASVTRYVLLVVAVFNAVANMIGYNTISSELANDIAAVISGLFILYAGWKNNYLSKKGVKQKEVLEQNNLK